MNKKTMLLGLSTLTLGGALMLTQAAQAYKGDPSVQGPNYTAERHEAMAQAFANKDYVAWQKLSAGRGVTRQINEANFAKFAEAHKLALEGKTEEAAAIRAELGLGQQNGSGSGQRNGNRNGNCNL